MAAVEVMFAGVAAMADEFMDVDNLTSVLKHFFFCISDLKQFLFNWIYSGLLK